MKWVVVFLIVVVMGLACGGVADSEDTRIADLEARVEAIEKALSPETLLRPWLSESQRQGLIDVSDLKWMVEDLQWRVGQLESPPYMPPIP